MNPGPRLIAAIKAVLPLLTTQQDERQGQVRYMPCPVCRGPCVHAAGSVATRVGNVAEQLRRQADELDARDRLITELRAALNEHEAVEAVRKYEGTET